MVMVPSDEDYELIVTKQKQAAAYLDRNGIDLWLVFLREGNDAVITSIIAGIEYVVQNAVLIVTRSGRTIALLEPIDVQNGAGKFFSEVISYRDDISGPLLSLLNDIKPARIALDYSRTDYGADGLTHGMYLRLQDMLGKDDLERVAVTAEGLITSILAQKTEEEIGRLTRAAIITAKISEDLISVIKPGVLEAELSEFIAARAGFYGASSAGASISANPRGENQKGPKSRPVQPGDVIVSDLGAVYKGYGADLKRCYYVLGPGETDVPELLARQWEVCQRTIEAARAALVPGAFGYEVDEIAWSAMEAMGYARDGHAFGHQVGRRSHDAGVWLGPPGNPYRPSKGRIEANMVFTLDPTINRVGLRNPGASCMGMEEMALVTPDGGRLLIPPATHIYCVPGV